MRSLNFNKKGQVGSLAPAILGLVFAAIVLVFGLIMSQELRDVDTLSETSTVTNETFQINVVTGISESSDFLNTCNWKSWNATLVMNKTIGGGLELQNNTLVEGTDYQVFTNNGSIGNISSDWNTTVITYDYVWGGSACEGANATVIGLGTFADFWEIIVLAVVITIVIGLLLVVFGERRSR